MNRNPLTVMDAITKVILLDSVPESMLEPTAGGILRVFQAVRTAKAKMSLHLAIWPDGTWAMLAHNPDWSHPRPEQLERAYRTAHSAGIRLFGTPASAKSALLGRG